MHISEKKMETKVQTLQMKTVETTTTTVEAMAATVEVCGGMTQLAHSHFRLEQLMCRMHKCNHTS